VENAKVTVDLRCPSHKCGVFAPERVVNAAATPEQRAKLADIRCKSLVDDNPQASWCTEPDCQLVALCRGEAPAQECAAGRAWACSTSRGLALCAPPA